MGPGMVFHAPPYLQWFNPRKVNNLGERPLLIVQLFHKSNRSNMYVLYMGTPAASVDIFCSAQSPGKCRSSEIRSSGKPLLPQVKRSLPVQSPTVEPDQ